MNASVKQPPALKRRALSAKQLQQPNNKLGSQGEESATSFLQSLGYSILELNTSFQSFEVDIIAFDPELKELVFCEVKTRSSTQFGHPSQAVNWKKLRSLHRVALQYQQQHCYDHDFRFDIITVSPDGIEHYKNVTSE